LASSTLATGIIFPRRVRGRANCGSRSQDVDDHNDAFILFINRIKEGRKTRVNFNSRCGLLRHEKKISERIFGQHGPAPDQINKIFNHTDKLLSAGFE
jgi:hypothetical protein